LRVDIGGNRLIDILQLEIDDTFHIPPDAQHYLLWMHVWFYIREWLLARIKPLLSATHVDITHSLFISSDNLIQKGLMLLSGKQRSTNQCSLNQVVFG
jgi:hypothetical protein